MKSIALRYLLGSFIITWMAIAPSSAQQKTDTTKRPFVPTPAQPSPGELNIGDQALKKANRQKTLTAMELFGKIYQVSFENISAEANSIGFKSTLFGIHKIFNPAITKSSSYKSLGLERRVEPSLKFAYKDNFSSMNATLGINLSLINANDKTSSKLLNDNPALLREIKSFDNNAQTYLLHLNNILNNGTPDQKKLAIENQSELEKLVRTGNTDNISTALGSDLKAFPVTLNDGTPGTLLTAAVALNDKINAVVKKIDNGWNVVLTPQLSYTFVQKKLQGYSLSANAVKGLFLLPKHTTQLKLKSAVIHGTDTIIPKADLNRQFLSNQLGINQVLFNKTIKNDDGDSEQIPGGEFTLSAGHDFVYKGTASDEKKSQPTLSAKLGFLVGKESWLLFPFTYNFERKEGVAMISVKVNLGEAPIKK